MSKFCMYVCMHTVPAYKGFVLCWCSTHSSHTVSSDWHMPSGRVMQTPRTVSSDWHMPSGRVMQTPRTQCPVAGICLVVG